MTRSAGRPRRATGSTRDYSRTDGVIVRSADRGSAASGQGVRPVSIGSDFIVAATGADYEQVLATARAWVTGSVGTSLAPRR